MSAGDLKPPPLTDPYGGKAVADWVAVTKQLVAAHPLKAAEIVSVVLDTWKGLEATRIGHRGFRLGIDIKPSPQIMGNFLHEIIPLEFQCLYPGTWRREANKKEKDLVHVPDQSLSVEIKTSSNKTKIFGNRSYGQPAAPGSVGKGKSGYHLTVNFEKFSKEAGAPFPRILQIRFGWLDHSDWSAQKAETGQQSSVKPESNARKFLVLYPPAK